MWWLLITLLGWVVWESLSGIACFTDYLLVNLAMLLVQQSGAHTISFTCFICVTNFMSTLFINTGNIAGPSTASSSQDGWNAKG